MRDKIYKHQVLNSKMAGGACLVFAAGSCFVAVPAVAQPREYFGDRVRKKPAQRPRPGGRSNGQRQPFRARHPAIFPGAFVYSLSSLWSPCRRAVVTAVLTRVTRHGVCGEQV